MIPVKVIPGIGRRGDKGEKLGGVNPSMIYMIPCKNLCKCHKVPPPSTTIKETYHKGSQSEQYLMGYNIITIGTSLRSFIGVQTNPTRMRIRLRKKTKMIQKAKKKK
jgi:hypothetical protein